jgi:hypothetical protein
MRRSLVGFILTGALLASSLPVQAAGPAGLTLIGPPSGFGFPFLPPLPNGGGSGTGTGTGTGSGAGNGGGTLIPQNPFRRTTTITTSTTTANLTLNSQSGGQFPGVAGSVSYQTVTVSTTFLGFTTSSTSATISGNISRTPIVDSNTIYFVLYYAGASPGRDLASAVVNSAGNGSFSLSSLNSNNLPIILQGDLVYANARIGGELFNLKVGRFGPPVVTQTTLSP